MYHIIITTYNDDELDSAFYEYLAEIMEHVADSVSFPTENPLVEAGTGTPPQVQPSDTPTTPEPSASEPVKVTTTASQEQAVKTARSYLDVMAFSRQGLIEQLVYEGFSNEDAAYGADHITVDWNAQAAKMARNYLDTMSFSRQGLIDQLVYEGFSAEEAAYGVSTVGL